MTLKQSEFIRLAPHRLHDGGEYDSWDTFIVRLDGEGYGGGIRLLKAMVKVFLHACQQRGVQLPERYFELSYETNIPRQAGLSGSSAIACAAFNCLLAYYDVGDRYAPVLTCPPHCTCADSSMRIKRSRYMNRDIVNLLSGEMMPRLAPPMHAHAQIAMRCGQSLQVLGSTCPEQYSVQLLGHFNPCRLLWHLTSVSAAQDTSGGEAHAGAQS